MANCISKAGAYLRPDDMVKAVQAALQDGGNEMMQTVADYWIEQGVEQGIKQGVKQGELEATRRIARHMLKLYDVDTVSKMTGLSIDELLALKAEEKNS